MRRGTKTTAVVACCAIQLCGCSSDPPTSVFDNGTVVEMEAGTLADVSFETAAFDVRLADVSAPLDGDNTVAIPFSPQPVITPGAPSNAPDLFGTSDAGSADASADASAADGGAESGTTADAGNGPAPCLIEPEPSVLFPRNWLRPRINLIPNGAQNLFEIRLHAAGAAADQLVYTDQAAWYMPKGMWKYLAGLVGTQPLDVTITVRGAALAGAQLTAPPSAAATTTFSVAPADAAGSIVYWTTSGGSALKGFVVGDESVGPVLTPNQVKMKGSGGQQVTCIGCHTSTPDGDFASFDTSEGNWALGLGSVQSASPGAQPTFLGAGGVAALTGGTRGIHTYSKAHWAMGDRIAITPFQGQLAWIDLEAAMPGQGQAYDFLARTGDSHGAGAPTWSHDGTTVVYVSTNALTDGRLDNGDADLFAVPYGNRAGGAAAAIAGAADPAFEEYYPAFSADDKLLAFNRIPSGHNMYNQDLAEVYVVPSAGGTPTSLAANDPPACSGRTNPGITNSWPKWSPEATHVGTSTYYWLIFSSRRSQNHNPQLYVTGIVVDDAGQVTTHGALYLWNQPETENNHTPAWDVFKIPPAPPPPIPH